MLQISFLGNNQLRMTIKLQVVVLMVVSFSVVLAQFVPSVFPGHAAALEGRVHTGIEYPRDPQPQPVNLQSGAVRNQLSRSRY